MRFVRGCTLGLGVGLVGGLLGCGGSGSDPRLEDIRLEVFSETNPEQRLSLDSLVPGQVARLQLTAQQGSQRVPVFVDGISLGAPANSARLGANGRLEALGPGGPFPLRIFVGGAVIERDVTVWVAGPTLSGQARDTFGRPVSNLRIVLFGGGTAPIFTLFTGADGRFASPVPVTAQRFGTAIDFATPTRLQPVFTYGLGTFRTLESVGTASCLPSLPPLATGVATALPNSIVVFDRDSPPPALSTCD